MSRKIFSKPNWEDATGNIFRQTVRCMFFLILLLLSPSQAKSKQFEIFDGRNYNGKYYPRIDIIEWGEPSHMEFQVYWKGHPIEMSFKLETKDNKKVMLVHYFIPERNEHLCRRVLAPGHFGDNFFIYRDLNDKDMDNTMVSMKEIPEAPGFKKLAATKFTDCDESEEERVPSSISENEKNAAHTSSQSHSPLSSNKGQRKFKTDKGAIRGAEQNVPFSDW